MAEREISRDKLQAALCSIYEAGLSDTGGDLLITIDGEMVIDPAEAENLSEAGTS